MELMSELDAPSRGRGGADGGARDGPRDKFLTLMGGTPQNPAGSLRSRCQLHVLVTIN